MRKMFLVLAFVLLASNAHASLLSGSITGWGESSTRAWGDGAHDVQMVWSTRHDTGGDGWFCGTNCSSVNANAYRYPGFTDPTSITDASAFTYAPDSFYAFEGDTIFYKTLAGYYGAFVIKDIYPNPGYPNPNATTFIPHTMMDGDWYFLTGQGADFSVGDGEDGGDGDSSAVPEPATLLLFGIGGAGLTFIRRKRLQ